MSDEQETEDGRDTESEREPAGLPDADEVPQEKKDQIESEREERLDADNRPDNVEVDNTQRTFDPGSGHFTDHDDYDPEARPFADEDDEAPEPAPAPEAGSGPDSESGLDTDSGSGSGSGEDSPRS